MTESGITIPKELQQAKRLAHLADSSLRIPIVGFRLGLDFLIGLIPVAGDIIMWCVALRIIYLGKKMQVPKPLLFRMLRNSLVDFGLGLLPFVGDVVDMFYKANNANVKMMEKWWVQQNGQDIQSQTEQALDQWRNKAS